MNGTEGTLPVIPASEVRSREPVRSIGTVAGILLAAGEGSRFGNGNKLLATLDGEPLVRHATGSLLQTDLDTVVAVVGHEADRVGNALEDCPIDVVENPDYTDGQASSVRIGTEAVLSGGRECPDAIVFALGDMPLVAPETVDHLIAGYRAGVGTVLAAGHEQRRGNPVLFGREHFDALRTVTGETGGREILLQADKSAVIDTGDPGVHIDVDTQADLQSLEGTG